jgi:hypothetical protein
MSDVAKKESVSRLGDIFRVKLGFGRRAEVVRMIVYRHVYYIKTYL